MNSCWQEDEENKNQPYPKLISPDYPLLLVVAVALIDEDGRILIATRPSGKDMEGLWEFPGGKILPYETPENALIRELKEELSIDTRKSCLAPIAFASHSYEKFHLLLNLFACRNWQGEISPMEGQKIRWVYPHELKNYKMPPADVPLIALLRDLL